MTAIEYALIAAIVVGALASSASAIKSFGAPMQLVAVTVAKHLK